MKSTVSLVAFAIVAALLLFWSETQGQPGKKAGGSPETVEAFIGKMMAFNKAKDGKLAKTELVDTRLHALFDRADSNKDGVVDRAELEAIYQREKLEGNGFEGKGPPKGKGPKSK